MTYSLKYTAVALAALLFFSAQPASAQIKPTGFTSPAETNGSQSPDEDTDTRYKVANVLCQWEGAPNYILTITAHLSEPSLPDINYYDRIVKATGSAAGAKHLCMAWTPVNICAGYRQYHYSHIKFNGTIFDQPQIIDCSRY